MYPATQPFVTGGAQLTVADAFPGAVDNCNGADGSAVQSPVPDTPGSTVTGADAGLVPAGFVSVTEHWYGWPCTKPVTVIGDPGPVACTVGCPVNDTHVTVKLFGVPEFVDVKFTMTDVGPANPPDTFAGAFGQPPFKLLLVNHPWNAAGPDTAEPEPTGSGPFAAPHQLHVAATDVVPVFWRP